MSPAVFSGESAEDTGFFDRGTAIVGHIAEGVCERLGGAENLLRVLQILDDLVFVKRADETAVPHGAARLMQPEGVRLERDVGVLVRYHDVTRVAVVADDERCHRNVVLLEERAPERENAVLPVVEGEDDAFGRQAVGALDERLELRVGGEVIIVSER